MSLQDEINRTKSHIENHQEAIRKLNAHGQALALKKLGLEIGDRIIATRRGREIEGVVLGIENWGSSYARPTARVVRKDGTVGKQPLIPWEGWRKK